MWNKLLLEKWFTVHAYAIIKFYCGEIKDWIVTPLHIIRTKKEAPETVVTENPCVSKTLSFIQLHTNMLTIDLVVGDGALQMAQGTQGR